MAKRLCKCGCGETFAPETRNQQMILGHQSARDRSKSTRTTLLAAKRAREAALALADRLKREERSPMTCPYRKVSECLHLIYGGGKRDCMTQRAKCACPLGHKVS